MTTTTFADRAIPIELGQRLREIFGLARQPGTLGELVALRREPPLEQQLYSEGPSRHAVRVGENHRCTHCVLDALLLPFVTGLPVEVASRSPGGESVAIHLDSGDAESSPPEAVVSLGAAKDDRGTVQETVCPFINAFPSRTSYERWATATPEAVTMAIPLAEAVAYAQAIASGAEAQPTRHGGSC